MSNHEQEKIIDELDRELSRKDNLIALAVCFGLGGWMVVMATINVLSVA